MIDAHSGDQSYRNGSVAAQLNQWGHTNGTRRPMAWLSAASMLGQANELDAVHSESSAENHTSPALQFIRRRSHCVLARMTFSVMRR